ncbi:MAG: trypsin-like peptidase domain-containing protein [Woeseiaceae bacterium]|nr:trypsin-like peptidase domain-containing protein [Woeseiaceae bacterium]
MKPALVFVLQSVVVGLAIAFLVVLVRPDLLPAVGSPGPAAPASYADAVDLGAPAVASIHTKRLVEISSTDGAPPRFGIESNDASAVIIDPEGYLVTNFHVVVGAADIQVGLSDGRWAEARLVGVDAETDLAVLKLDVGTLPAIRMGNSGQLRIGDVVLAIGNPYGLTKSVTQGIVSAVGRGMLNLTTFENFIQTDAAINAGNSGGALINARGELVGINTAVLAQDVGTEGISFAIPVDLVRGVFAEIREHGRVLRGWLGFKPDDMTPAEREELGIERDAGILLVEIYAGGPAEASGLTCGDVLLEINGEPIYSQRQARLIVAGSNPGDDVEVLAWRDGREIRLTILAGERPDTDALPRAC